MTVTDVLICFVVFLLGFISFPLMLWLMQAMVKRTWPMDDER
jgi:hypothetical protein